MDKSVIGIVESQAVTERIVSELQAEGVQPSAISVLLPDTDDTRDFAHEHNTKAPEGAAAGASAGGLVGGTLGLLAGIGALAIPGLGPFIAAGPPMATLSGAAAGAAFGGVGGRSSAWASRKLKPSATKASSGVENILIAAQVETSEAQTAAEAVFEKNSAHDDEHDE